ncbi:putative calcium-binding protein CML22 [Iris pallida]|uniref:Calcium-binding protein CML22 n=1 Tax=Iris pallida TaxID=29817 RepID=A0AAX6HQ27_IRIPA|nr:putative calcium-binding protein CML22 [Iris pallida]
MKGHQSGSFRPCPAMKSFFSEKVGCRIFSCNSQDKYSRITHEIEKKLIKAIRKRAASQKSFKSINSIILRFPRFKEELKNIKDIFDQYDEDSNGTINHEELRNCLSDLHIHLPEEEVDALYEYCDIDGKEGIQYNEFIVLLCIFHLLMEPASASQDISRIGSVKLEATFDTLAEAFAFLDKNGDGKLRRKEVILALNEGSPREKSPTHITTKLFKEMDWNKDGKVNFKEFLFALTKWIGFDNDDDDDEKES